MMWCNFFLNFNKIIVKLNIQNVYKNNFEIKDYVDTSCLFSLMFFSHWIVFNDTIHFDLKL